MTQNNWFVTTAVVIGLSMAPAVAAAQVCAGFPTANGQTSLAITATFPENADQFGAEGSLNVVGPFALFGGFQRTTVAEQNAGHANTYTAGAALDITGNFVGAFPLGLSACPVASASLTTLESADVWRVPVGVGFGGRIGMGPEGTLELLPYVVPQLVWTRVDFEEAAPGGVFDSLFGRPDTVEDTEETDLALRTGVLLGAGRFYFGGEFTNVFNDEVRGVFGVKAGVRF